MLFSCTLKDGIVYLPTVAKTEAGFYMNREPVAVVPVANTDTLRGALRNVIKMGNRVIPTPARDAYPPPVLPKYAGAKTWSAFMRGASEWKITQNNGVYQIIPYRRDPEGSESWVEHTEQKIAFPLGTTADDVIERMILVLQDAARSATEDA